MSECQLEKNFNLKEFQCRDGTPVPEDMCDNVAELAKNLQVIRDTICKPMIIISGYRSPEYNTKIDGAKRSQHLLAKAADIVVPDMEPSELKEVIESLIEDGKITPGGVGIYSTFVHYDIRGYNRRWSG